jgi:hypothetical protein
VGAGTRTQNPLTNSLSTITSLPIALKRFGMNNGDITSTYADRMRSTISELRSEMLSIASAGGLSACTGSSRPSRRAR